MHLFAREIYLDLTRRSFAGDWRSDLLPLITGNKRRFSIFTRAKQKVINAAREMKDLLDLSALIKKKLSGAKKTPSATPDEMTSSGPLSLVIPPAPAVGPVNVDSSREDLARESSDRETAEPSVTDGNRKKRSAPGPSASIETQTGTGSDESPKKKTKKEKKKRKKSVEERSEPSGDVEGRELVALDSSNRDVATQTSVELDDSSNVL